MFSGCFSRCYYKYNILIWQASLQTESSISHLTVRILSKSRQLSRPAPEIRLHLLPIQNGSFSLTIPIPSKVPMLLSQTALRKKFHSPLSPLRQLLSSLRSLPVPQDPVSSFHPARYILFLKKMHRKK